MNRNWKKGLLRLWMVATILWIAFMAVAVRPDRALVTYNDEPTYLERTRPGLARARRDEAREDLYLFFGGGLVAPFVILVSGFALGWALRGFKPDS